jgi:outer membrane protein assembly factor BamB
VWHDGDVLAAAGRALHALDARSGRPRWTADVGALVAGRPAADDAAVYVGAGDGRAHAFDRRTGERRWAQVIATRESPYRTLIYGPWATQATLLPANRVLVANVVAAYALDRATGAIAWQVAGGFMYNRALLLEDRLVLADERGNVVAVDPLTGAELWRVTLPQRVIGGGPVRWGTHVAAVGVNGLVARLDPASGADAGRFRATVDYVHGVAAAAGRVLVSGGQDGVLRGVAA